MKKMMPVLAVLLALCGCSSAEKADEPVNTPEPVIETAPAETPVPEETPEPDWNELLGEKETYTELYQKIQESKAINQDVVGWVYFPSGLVSQPVLQGTDNAFYLRHDWTNMQPLDWGSIYMDFRNDLSAYDMNTILYGNYVYTSYSSDRTLVFTPLAQLRDEANYEANKYVTFVTDDEIRLCEVAHVFDCPTEYVEGGQIPARGFEFNEMYFTEEKLNELINNIKGIEFYHTGVEIVPGDRLFMMQTCVENHTEVRQINVCRELGRYPVPKE